jgi:hypothetical protein
MHAPVREDALNPDQFMRFMAGHIDTPYVIQRPTRDPSPSMSTSSFTDSSFADENDYRARAAKGSIHFLGHAPVMWSSHKINRQSPNSNAAEQAAAACAIHDTVWMRSLLVELGAWDSIFRAPLFCDNNGVAGIANETIGLTHRNRWMRVDYFHFRDFQRAGDMLVKRAHTNDNAAYFFTKNTGTGKLQTAVAMLTGAEPLGTTRVGLRACMYHAEVSSDPMPDTPISPEERRRLQSVCEDPYTALDEEDHRDDEREALRGQSAISIRGVGHSADGQVYADFGCILPQSQPIKVIT